jgi:hypothetical protein
VLSPSKHNENYVKEKQKKVFNMCYIVSKSFQANKLSFSPEVISFMEVCEHLVLDQYPENVQSNEFRFLIQSYLFSKEYFDSQEKAGAANLLYKKIIESIRQGYGELLEGEHRSYNINKICRMLSQIENPKLGEQALLKDICTVATKDLESMPFSQFLHTLNMVFPFMHRE